MSPSTLTIVVRALLLTPAIELLTVVLRFGFKLRGAVTTAPLARFTCGLRIHHGYAGLLLAAAAWVCRGFLDPRLVEWTVALGLALIASDLIHHFVVLRLATGSSEFDFFYPRPARSGSHD